MDFRFWLPGLCLALASVPGPVRAADLFGGDVTDVLRGDTASVEAFTGYATGSSKEYVFNVPGGSRLSQLNWDLGNALAVGGRVAVRPLDWLTIRARGWVTVEADSRMHDFDWLYGYQGADSFSHISVSPNTMTPRAWQGDASVAATVWQADDLTLTAIGGFRHYQAKFEARGGSYLYSVDSFRDTSGTLPNDRIGITYRQYWDAPYLGLGASYSAADWSLTTELIGSPVVQGRADDNHALRSIYFRDKLGTSAMLGATTAIEYRFAQNLSLVGRAEYTKFFQAKGSETAKDYGTGEFSAYQKPGVGAEAETFLLSIGLKARI